jgi:hypothetical protein
MPTNAQAGLKLPVIVYGVGGCSDSGTNTQSFHNEIASYEFIVIVNNGPSLYFKHHSIEIILSLSSS